jgi:medium-chain acyl-[acyl-carrier-protein] hydrolase
MRSVQAAATNPWLAVARPDPLARLRLFCFAYAGGDASVFRSWPDNLPAAVEVYPVRLPGRGPRLSEEPFRRLPALVEALVPALLPHTDKPFAFFGHSMGALVAFEVARRLRRVHRVEPAHLFLSGSSAPQLPRTGKRTYDLPDAEFVENLRRLNGTPREVLEHGELLELIMGQLRADFELIQTYTYTSEPPLSCGVSVFGGLDDCPSGAERLAPWREQTTGAFSLSMLPGDHFFIHSSEHLLFRLLSQKLRQLTA